MIKPHLLFPLIVMASMYALIVQAAPVKLQCVTDNSSQTTARGGFLLHRTRLTRSACI